MVKFLSLAFGVSVGVAIFLGVQWYRYVINTTSPYDELGISLNSMMPDPLNAWGCAHLRQNFAAALPPYGCLADDGKSWRKG